MWANIFMCVGIARVCVRVGGSCPSPHRLSERCPPYVVLKSAHHRSAFCFTRLPAKERKWLNSLTSAGMQPGLRTRAHQHPGSIRHINQRTQWEYDVKNLKSEHVGIKCCFTVSVWWEMLCLRGIRMWFPALGVQTDGWRSARAHQQSWKGRQPDKNLWTQVRGCIWGSNEAPPLDDRKKNRRC